MSRKHEGRDVFVSGAETAERVKEVFSYAFALRNDQMFLEGYPQDEYLDALRRGDVMTIYELDPRGTFRYKVEMEFTPSIDVGGFQRGAENYDVAIAYSVDEGRDDYEYYVATKDGVTVRQLSFTDVDDSYICNLV